MSKDIQLLDSLLENWCEEVNKTAYPHLIDLWGNYLEFVINHKKFTLNYKNELCQVESVIPHPQSLTTTTIYQIYSIFDESVKKIKRAKNIEKYFVGCVKAGIFVPLSQDGYTLRVSSSLISIDKIIHNKNFDDKVLDLLKD